METNLKRKREGELDGETFAKKVRDDRTETKQNGLIQNFNEFLEQESTFIHGGLFGLLLNVDKIKNNEQFKGLLIAGNARLSCRNKNLALLASGAFYPNGIFKYNLFNTCDEGAAENSCIKFVKDRFFSQACLVGESVNEILDLAYQDVLKYKYSEEFLMLNSQETMKHFDPDYTTTEARDYDYYKTLKCLPIEGLLEYTIPKGSILVICTTLVDLLSTELGGAEQFKNTNPIVFKDGPMTNIPDLAFHSAVLDCYESFIAVAPAKHHEAKQLDTKLTNDIYIEFVNQLMLNNGINHEMQPCVTTFLNDFYRAVIDSPNFEGRKETSIDYMRAAATFTINETKLSNIIDLNDSSYGVTCPVNYECISNIYTKLLYELAMVTGPRTAVTCKLPDSEKEYAMRSTKGMMALMCLSLNENPTNIIYFIQLCRALPDYNIPISIRNELKQAGLWSADIIKFLELNKGDLSQCPLVPDALKNINSGSFFKSRKECRLVSSCNALEKCCPYDALIRMTDSDFFSLTSRKRPKRKFEQTPSIYLMDAIPNGKTLDKLGGLNGKLPTSTNKFGKVSAVRLKDEIMSRVSTSDILEDERIKTITEKSVQSACSIIDDGIESTIKRAYKATDELLRGSIYDKLLQESGGVFDIDDKVTLAGQKDFWRFKSKFNSQQMQHRLLYGGFSEAFVNQSKLYRLAMLGCASSLWQGVETQPTISKLESELKVTVTNQKSAIYTEVYSKDPIDLKLNTAYVTLCPIKSKQDKIVGWRDISSTNQKQNSHVTIDLMKFAHFLTKCLLGFYKRTEPFNEETEPNLSDFEDDEPGEDTAGILKTLYKQLIRQNRLLYGEGEYLNQRESEILKKIATPSSKLINDLLHPVTGILKMFSVGHPIESMSELTDTIVTAIIMKCLGIETKGIPKTRNGAVEIRKESDLSGLTFYGPSDQEPDKKILQKKKTMSPHARGHCVLMSAVQMNSYTNSLNQMVREFQSVNSNDYNRCALLSKLQMMSKHHILRWDNPTALIYFYPLGGAERFETKSGQKKTETPLDKLVFINGDDTEMAMLKMIKKNFKKIYADIYKNVCKIISGEDVNDVNFDLECRREVADYIPMILKDKYEFADIEHFLTRDGEDFILNLNINALNYLVTLLTSDDEDLCADCYDRHLEELKKRQSYDTVRGDIDSEVGIASIFSEHTQQIDFE